MSALLLKSKNALNPSVEPLDYVVYKSRVIADGGTIVNEQATKAAIEFANVNSITESMAFSVTSPAWGIKVVNGQPNKLYSLFNSAGDIIVGVGNSAAIELHTVDTYNTILIKGSSANTLISAGVINNVNNAGLCVIAKPPTLAAGTNYSPINVFALAELSNIDAASSASDRAARQILSMSNGRADTSKMPVDWKFAAQGFGATGGYTDAGSSADNWSSESAFIDNSGLVMFRAGISAGADPTVTPPLYKNGVRLNIGRSVVTTLQALTYSTLYYGDIAEAWALVNTSSAIMQALSLRASQTYV